jgi:hypothetical protein
VQIAEPIVRSTGTLQEHIAEQTTCQVSKSVATPPAAGQISTPPPCTNTTPEIAPSSASATDEVKLHSSTTVPSFKFTADRVPFLLQLLPESSGKIKRKNDEAIENPRSKKGLHF